MITGVNKIGLDVADQEAARRFWTEVVGFEVVYDVPYGDHRWIEVRPPGGAPAIVLSARRPGQPDPAGTMAHVLFECDDVQRTHRELLERGVKFTRAPSGEFFGWSAIFSDPEGRLFVIGQRERKRRPRPRPEANAAGQRP